MVFHLPQVAAGPSPATVDRRIRSGQKDNGDRNIHLKLRPPSAHHLFRSGIKNRRRRKSAAPAARKKIPAATVMTTCSEPTGKSQNRFPANRSCSKKTATEAETIPTSPSSGSDRRQHASNRRQSCSSAKQPPASPQSQPERNISSNEIEQSNPNQQHCKSRQPWLCIRAVSMRKPQPISGVPFSSSVPAKNPPDPHRLPCSAEDSGGNDPAQQDEFRSTTDLATTAGMRLEDITQQQNPNNEESHEEESTDKDNDDDDGNGSSENSLT
ncbi:hypothetical protein ACLOJK_019208 [Asimina triloba]